MQHGKVTNRSVQALKTSRTSRATLRQEDDSATALKALEALNTAYNRITRVLNDKIDHPRSNVGQISNLGGQLRWVAERHRLIKTALKAGPGMVAYVCGDCADVQQLRPLAETAAKLAAESKSYPAAINLLSYIDQELGWTPLAQSA